MADEADIAKANEEGILQRRIAAVMLPVIPQGHSHCIDCGDEIAPARRKANPHAKRCIDCQEAREAGTPHLGGRG